MLEAIARKKTSHRQALSKKQSQNKEKIHQGAKTYYEVKWRRVEGEMVLLRSMIAL